MNTWTSGLLTRYKSGMEPSFDIMSAWCFVQWRRKVCGQCWLLLRIYVHRMYLKRDVARALCGTTISGWTWITWKLPQQLRDVLHISQLSFTLKYGPTSKSKLKTTWLSFMIRRQLTRIPKEWLCLLSTRLKLTGVTEVLNVDTIKQYSLHLLKMLDNCKDYFCLRLLICNHCIVRYHYNF